MEQRDAGCLQEGAAGAVLAELHQNAAEYPQHHGMGATVSTQLSLKLEILFFSLTNIAQ